MRQGEEDRPLYVTDHDERGRMVRARSTDYFGWNYTFNWTYHDEGFVSSYEMTNRNEGSHERGSYRATKDNATSQMLETYDYTAPDGTSSTRRRKILLDAQGGVLRVVDASRTQDVLLTLRHDVKPGVQVIETYREAETPDSYRLKRFDHYGVLRSECHLDKHGLVTTLTFHDDLDEAGAMVASESIAVESDIIIDIGTLALLDPFDIYRGPKAKQVKVSSRSLSIRETAFDRDVLSSRWFFEREGRMQETRRVYATDEHGNWSRRETSQVTVAPTGARSSQGIEVIERWIEYW